MSRKDDLLAVFESVNKDILTVVGPMIDEMVFLEGRLTELRSKPHIRYNPKDDSIQKPTVAYRQYKEMLAQYKDVVRILCLQLGKHGMDEEDSPLRSYLKTLDND